MSVSAVCVCCVCCVCLLCVLVQDLRDPPDPPPLRRTAPPPLFFPPTPIFILFFSLRVSSRGILVVSGVPQDNLRAKTSTFEVPTDQNTTKIPREDPQREEKRMKMGVGEGKKSAKFWAPHPSGPHPSGAPPFLGLGSHPSGAHPAGPHRCCRDCPNLVWAKLQSP